jgi:hypothetical protein
MEKLVVKVSDPAKANDALKQLVLAGKITLISANEVHQAPAMPNQQAIVEGILSLQGMWADHDIDPKQHRYQVWHRKAE